ncbi:MAG: TfoX/Sxy family protein [Gemmatimonadaceae bacterium]|jgi:TfoX/Sxy family transcriptional regulator of competence genes|nr:TfoX/Sxy family protein [Gemmatimonadaceae bacterium]
MAYDEQFATRIRAALGDRSIVERRMFGGVGYLLNGNLCCGIHRGMLMLHVANEDTEALLGRAGASSFVMRSRTMRGWVLVEPDATRTTRQLAQWIAPAIRHAESLPPKPVRAPKAPSRERRARP